MEHQKFSVAMSVYKKDNAIWLRAALNSIYSQTIQPDEVLLVVDGWVPTEIKTVIQEYMNRRTFKPIWLQENRGLGNAMRVAVQEARYELIARMDSDDIAVPDRFEQLLCLFLNDPSLDIVGGNIAEFIGNEANIVAYREVPCRDREIKEYMQKRCPFNHMTIMLKKDAVLKAGNYQDWFWNEDYYLWIRMLENGCKMANTGTILVNVRVGKDMYKRRGGWKYFCSEAKLQKYMLDKQIIGVGTYLMNIAKRLIVQVLLPNSLRGFVFQKFARKTVTKS